MPINAPGCSVSSNFGNGCTHWTTMPDAKTYSNNGKDTIGQGNIDSIVLINVPQAIRGPYHIDREVSFGSNQELRLEGPFQGQQGSDQHPLMPGGWTLRITAAPQANGSGGGDHVMTATLRLNPFLGLSPDTLRHFDVAWSGMHQDLQDRMKAMDDLIKDLRTAQKMSDPSFNKDNDRRGDDDSDNDSDDRRPSPPPPNRGHDSDSD